MTIDDLTPGMVVRLYGDRFPLGYVTATVIDADKRRKGGAYGGGVPRLTARATLDSPEAPEALIYQGMGLGVVIWGTTHHITRMEEVDVLKDDYDDRDDTNADCDVCGGVGGDAPHTCVVCRGTGVRR